jgi:hypothetical protein
VVARDGIEPPTPAFSGPRSTTELSGLGELRERVRAAKIGPGTNVCLTACLTLSKGKIVQVIENLSSANRKKPETSRLRNVTRAQTQP